MNQSKGPGGPPGPERKNKMFDRNGKEIKTGDVVEISGAYFKTDNGLYFVEHSPGDPYWSGSDHSLRKCSKKGKPSTAKYSVGFWPLLVTVSDRFKRAEAWEWNKEHATVEVKEGIDRAAIADHFREELKKEQERLEWLKRRFEGEGPEADKVRERIAFLDGVVAGIN